MMNGFAVWIFNIVFGEADPPSARAPWHIFNPSAVFSVISSVLPDFCGPAALSNPGLVFVVFVDAGLSAALARSGFHRAPCVETSRW